MELIEHLAMGFTTAMTLQNLLYAFLGCLLGTLIGVLPGLGPVATIAMLLPATYALEPASALIMLAGIYYGAQYGGSTTAILVNMPGESSSVVTALDGYQMARNGKAGLALSTAALGSFFAGTVGTLLLAAFSVPLTELAMDFGPADYFFTDGVRPDRCGCAGLWLAVSGYRDDPDWAIAGHGRHGRQFGYRSLQLRSA